MAGKSTEAHLLLVCHGQPASFEHSKNPGLAEGADVALELTARNIAAYVRQQPRIKQVGLVTSPANRAQESRKLLQESLETAHGFGIVAMNPGVIIALSDRSPIASYIPEDSRDGMAKRSLAIQGLMHGLVEKGWDPETTAMVAVTHGPVIRAIADSKSVEPMAHYGGFTPVPFEAVA